MEAALTKPDLLRLAVRRGYKVSDHQLKRWRLEGLIKRPEQLHLPGRRGSLSAYPPGSDAQLIAVCEVRKEERRFDELRIRVWWEGHWVDPTLLRASLRTIASEQLEGLERFLDQNEDPLDVIERDGPSDRHPLVRFIRRNLGGNPEDVVTVLYSLLQVALGDEPTWDVPAVGPEVQEDSPEHLLQRAIGLDRAASESSRGFEPLLEEKPDAETMFGWLPLEGVASLVDTIDDASDEELVRARDDAKVFIDDLAAIAGGLETVLGRNAFGLGFFRLFTVRDRLVWTLRALAIPGFVMVRRHLPGELIDTVADAIRGAAPSAQSFLEQHQGGGGTRPNR